MSESTTRPLLRVKDLSVQFTLQRGLFGRKPRIVRAVDGVSLSIQRGKTLGVVGESGCGKSTLGRAILRLIPAGGGSVSFDGCDIFTLGRDEMRRMRRRMQIIFQDPASSLNPRMNIETIVGEALMLHGLTSTRKQRRARVVELLARVGLSSDAISRYPHEFSGGQRQRIVIARALSLEPEFIVCDEPVSALDVSIQAQILNLLADLRDEFGLTYLFIAHDLAVVEHFSDEVAVMYLGRFVEHASADELYRNPRHPYTQALLAAVPIPDPSAAKRTAPLAGEVPSPIDPPTGCAFHPRCPFAEDRCRQERPSLQSHSTLKHDHLVACHFADRIPPGALVELTTPAATPS